MQREKHFLFWFKFPRENHWLSTVTQVSKLSYFKETRVHYQIPCSLTCFIAAFASSRVSIGTLYSTAKNKSVIWNETTENQIETSLYEEQSARVIAKIISCRLQSFSIQQLIFKWKPSDLIQRQIKQNENSLSIVVSHKILTNRLVTAWELLVVWIRTKCVCLTTDRCSDY